MRKSKLLSLFVAATLTAGCVGQLPLTASAATRYTRVMEYIDRGLVAIPKSYGDETKGMFLSWRLLGTESLSSTTFDIYKNGTILVSNYNGTSYTDTSNSNGSDTSAVYYVVKSGAGITSSDVPANTVIVNGSKKTLTMTGGYENSSYSELNAYGYFDVPLSVPSSVTDSKAGTYTYTANDCSVGDVDGDGQYEIIVKWDPSNSKDNASTGYTGKVLLSCYEFDGTQLWSNPIDLGYNIRAGAHYTQFIVYDLDGDGYSEIVMKTAPGSKDAKGNYVTAKGNTSTITSADNSADYRTSGGYIISGPEYLTVFKGSTGEALRTIDYTPYYNVTSNWGDSYGNRSNRHLAAVGYFGNKDSSGNLLPSVVMCRGYYTQAYVVAYDWDGSNLTQRFYHKGTSSGSSSLYGQGNHNLTVSDVDNDGYDEIVYGSAVLDNTGSVLSNTRLGHGDAMHVNDFNNDGTIEVFQVHEDSTGYASYGGDFWVASSGSHKYGLAASGDVGRGVMANIDDDYAASNSNARALGWTSAHASAYNLSGSAVAAKPTASSRTMTNSLVYWDGDLGRELLDDAIIGKYDASTGTTSRFYFAKNGSMDISTNNSTKYNACLTGDIFGDWREEIIGRYGNSLRVYISALTTKYKLTTLMHDSQYRLSVATENVGYNIPPHTSYYVGTASLASSSANYLAPAYAYTVMTTPKGGSSSSGSGSSGSSGSTGTTGLDGYYNIKSAYSGKYLDIENDSSANAAVLIQNTYNSSDMGQKFKLVSAGNGYYYIYTGISDYTKALDVSGKSTANGTSIIQYTYNGNTNQKFKLSEVSSGTYAILTGISSDASCFDVYDWSTADGGYIKQYEYWGGSCQLYTLEKTSSSDKPETSYYFDFGSGSTQSGYTAVKASTTYSSSTGYGWSTSSQSDMSRAPGSITSGYENLYNDQTMGDGIVFNVDLTNGNYDLTFHYGSWNTGFGTKYTVESGAASGNLYSTTAAKYTTQATVKDGQMNITIAKGAKSYGGYINGLDIVPSSDQSTDFSSGSSSSGSTTSYNLSWSASASASAGTTLMTGLTTVSDLTYQAVNTTISGTAYTGWLTSSNNGGWSSGAATGTALKFVAPATGTLKVNIATLGSSSNSKTAYIVKSGTSSYSSGYVSSVTGNGSNATISASVTSGETYYIFVAGSKGRFCGASFTN